MARTPKKPSTSRRTGVPGAAKSLPQRVVSRVPLMGRWIVSSPEPAPPRSRLARLLPRRVAALLPARKPIAEPRLRIPLITPMLRGVRQPLVRTAAVVQVAREARKPRTRWERLREAARKTLDDPAAAARWEHLMSLSVGLAAGRVEPKVEPKTVRFRSPLARVLRPRTETPIKPARGLRARLKQLQDLLNENAGPGRSRGRRGTAKQS